VSFVHSVQDERRRWTKNGRGDRDLTPQRLLRTQRGWANFQRADRGCVAVCVHYSIHMNTSQSRGFIGPLGRFSAPAQGHAGRAVARGLGSENGVRRGNFTECETRSRRWCRTEVLHLSCSAPIRRRVEIAASAYRASLAGLLWGWMQAAALQGRSGMMRG